MALVLCRETSFLFFRGNGEERFSCSTGFRFMGEGLRVRSRS